MAGPAARAVTDAAGQSWLARAWIHGGAKTAMGRTWLQTPRPAPVGLPHCSGSGRSWSAAQCKVSAASWSYQHRVVDGMKGRHATGCRRTPARQAQTGAGSWRHPETTKQDLPVRHRSRRGPADRRPHSPGARRSRAPRGAAGPGRSAPVMRAEPTAWLGWACPKAWRLQRGPTTAALPAPTPAQWPVAARQARTRPVGRTCRHRRHRVEHQGGMRRAGCACEATSDLRLVDRAHRPLWHGPATLPAQRVRKASTRSANLP